ncbi:MAG TPA: universal stress protein [Blastocatellia bacterium]|nr:universal stress protein [Blastocatellia bacterium]
MSIQIILVPVDFSENSQVAFEAAYDLALQLGAKLYVLHVQDESTLRIAIKEELLSKCSTDEEVQSSVERLTEERFSKMLSSMDTSKVAIEHTSRRGDSDKEIVAYAREIEADMIVIGRRGAGIISAVLGSVAESVVKKSPCPVLVVRLEHKKQQ